MGDDPIGGARRDLGLQSLAFAGLAFSLLLVGSITGAMLDEFFFDGGHRITISMLALGSLSLVACVAAATAAIAVGAGLGYRGTPYAVLWRTIVGVGAIVQVDWIFMVASSGGDPGVGSRVGWCVALAAGVVAGVWCAMEWRDRASAVTAPVPPMPVG
jgi:hypothetical protein